MLVSTLVGAVCREPTVTLAVADWLKMMLCTCSEGLMTRSGVTRDKMPQRNSFQTFILTFHVSIQVKPEASNHTLLLLIIFSPFGFFFATLSCFH